MLSWMERKSRGAAPSDGPEPAPEGIVITGQAGLLCGMHVATAHGWRAVEDVRVGDRVLTFDHGFQPVTDIQRDALALADAASAGDSGPLLVPRGALGNGADLWIMPEQGFLVESETVLDMMDDPFAVIPAQALKGFRGIRPAVPKDPARVSTLAFRNDEVIYVEGGLLAHCPRPRCIFTEAVPRNGLYQVLNPRAARYLVACLSEDNDVGALVCDDAEIAAVVAHGRPAEDNVPA